VYAAALEEAGALERLEGFASFYGPDFYQLPRNSEQVTLRKESWRVPNKLPFIGTEIVPLGAGEEMSWIMQ